MCKTVLFLLALLSMVSSAWADKCSYEYIPGKSKLSWTAFKTPKKVGVGAKFDNFKITALPGDSILDVIKTGVFTIDASSVNSGNQGRDQKIAGFFFSTMLKGPVIMGHVGKIIKDQGKKGALEVWFDINGVREPVRMDYTIDQNVAVLTGTIDVLAYGLKDELASLNKACKTLHQGKTWSDVDLTLEARFKKICQ